MLHLGRGCGSFGRQAQLEIWPKRCLTQDKQKTNLCNLKRGWSIINWIRLDYTFAFDLYLRRYCIDAKQTSTSTASSSALPIKISLSRFSKQGFAGNTRDQHKRSTLEINTRDRRFVGAALTSDPDWPLLQYLFGFDWLSVTEQEINTFKNATTVTLA